MSLYIINSPFQLFNALNYKKQCDKESNSTLILVCRSEINHKQVKEVLKKHNIFSNVIDISKNIYSGNKLTKFFVYLQFFFLKIYITFHAFSQTIIIGDAHYNKIKLLLQWLYFNKLIILDDGMLTALYNFSDICNSFKVKNNNIVVFTMLNVDIKPLYKIENKFLYFNEKTLSEKENNDIYFIGQPLVELKIMSYQEYLNQFRKIINQFKNNKISYIPHRAELESKLIQLKKDVDTDLRFFNFNQSIEFELLDGLTKPLKWIGFYSSALLLLKKIEPSKEVLAIDIRSFVDNKMQKSLQNVYKEFEENLIEII